MSVTKEKVLAILAVGVASIVLASARVPAIPPVEPVPPEESVRLYTSAPGSGGPRLAPEEVFGGGRDPFQTDDAWTEALPAVLATPPPRPWPRALPGGVTPLPRGPRDRVLIEPPSAAPQ